MPTLPEDPLAVTHVRGVGLLAFRATILATLPKEDAERLQESLSPESSALLRKPPQADEWIPFLRLAEIRDAFQRLFGYRLEKVRGLTLANLIFSHPDFHFLRGCGDVDALLAQCPRIWSAFHRGGRIATARPGPNLARIEMQATFPYPEYVRDVLPVAFQEALHLMGLVHGKVVYSQPDPPGNRHRFDLTWG